MDTPSNLQERVLVAQAPSGNEAAFMELVRRHPGQVYGLSFNMLRNREDAEGQPPECIGQGVPQHRSI